MLLPICLRYLRRICSATLAIYLLGGLVAQSTFADPEDALDPSGRVGRIAWIDGTVRLSNPQTGESFPVPLNQPLTSGDILRTEPGARAEIQIGSTIIRLDGESELDLAQIDDARIRLQLNNGRLVARLPSRETLADFELTTRDARFLPREIGVYRVDTDSRSTVATVYEGNLQAESGRTMVMVEPGQGAQFWDVGAPSQSSGYRFLTAVDDDFTRWSVDRDQQWYELNSSPSYARYVSPEMTGAADLDRYGDWSETAEYGALWLPRRVSSDWAPYRNGHWVWVDPWGWNWVGDEPWGFAPFHYGRWVRYRGAWAWVPGTRVVRPVYSPAMVAWVGSSGVSVSFSFGSRPGPNVGWFPLAPREVYVPVFRSSPRYVVNVNRTHVTRIANVNIIASEPGEAMRHRHYANRDLPQAVSRLPANAWRRDERSAMPRFEPRRRSEPERAVTVAREVDRRQMDRRHEFVREPNTRRVDVPSRVPRKTEVDTPMVRNAAPPAVQVAPLVQAAADAPSGRQWSGSEERRESRRENSRESSRERSRREGSENSPELRRESRSVDRSADRRVQSVPDGGGHADEDWRKKRRPRNES